MAASPTEDSHLAAAPLGGYGSAPLAAPVAEGMITTGPGAATAGAELQEDKPATATLCPNPVSSILCGLIPCSILCSIRQLNVNEQAAALYWGEYTGTISNPGLYLMNPFGLELWRISTKRNTMQLKEIKVLDKKGNPVIVNGIVTFAGTSAKKATVDVSNPWPMGRQSATGQSFLELQATAVLKRIASRFPYEAPAGELSLQTEGATISDELRRELQSKVAVTGAHILAFDLIDLSYAPEIAQVMLVRQQAEALVDARKVIVSAAVDMTKDAVSGLGEGMDEKTCHNLAANLLTVICSERGVTPTMSVGK